jgi:hypothetical protein
MIYWNGFFALRGVPPNYLAIREIVGSEKRAGK